MPVPSSDTSKDSREWDSTGTAALALAATNTRVIMWFMRELVEYSVAGHSSASFLPARLMYWLGVCSKVDVRKHTACSNR